MEGARADFDAAIKLNPRDWAAYNGRSKVYFLEGNYPQAISALSRALEINSDNDWARKTRIIAYVSLDNYDTAIEEAELFHALRPDSTEVADILAELYIKAGLPEKAVAFYAERIKADPTNAQLPTNLGDILTDCSPKLTAKEGCAAQRKLAVEAFDQAIALKPTAYAYTARSQARPGDAFELKRHDIDAALALEPNSVFALTSRASLYLSLKEYEKSLADTTAALAIQPDYDQAYRVRGAVYEKEGRIEDALKDWDRLTELRPKDAQGFNNACWARATHNIQLDKALTQCNTAISLAPKAAHILDSRGFLELRLGQLEASITDYDAALTLSPKLSPSLFGRGLAKLRKGDKTGGDADLKAARDIYADIDKTFAEYGVTADGKMEATGADDPKVKSGT